MSEPTIAQKTPVRVEVEQGKDYWWCTCGNSKRQPFCDGSHKGSAFQPMKWTADATGGKIFCCCKRTRHAPFCDGSHTAL